MSFVHRVVDLKIRNLKSFNDLNNALKNELNEEIARNFSKAI